MGGIGVGVAVCVGVGVGVGDIFIVAGAGVVAGATVGDCIALVCVVTVRGRVSVEVCEVFEVCAWTKSAGASISPHRMRINEKFK
jgi:hypothetical protein